MDKLLKIIAFIIMLIAIILPEPSYAAEAGDKFITCDIDGTEKETVFTKAEITVSGIDVSGKYIYYGIDVAVFKKPDDYKQNKDEWEETAIRKRIETNSLQVELEDLGSMSDYEYDKVYSLAYRVLYRPVGSQENSIFETEWKKVKINSDNDILYYKVVLAETIPDDKFVTCNIMEKETGTIFTKATVTVTGIDTSGKYIYYGIDVGVFKKPDDYKQNLDEWEEIGVKKRIETNSLQVELEDLGSMSDYEYDKVYSLAYRVLYRPVGSQENPVIETEWKKVKIDSNNDILYYKKIPYIKIEEALTDRVTGANLWMDADGKYTDDEKELNRYFLNSQVMSKLVLDPNNMKGVNVKDYEIEIDVNAPVSDINKEVYIEYIKIMAIDYTY